MILPLLAAGGTGFFDGTRAIFTKKVTRSEKNDFAIGFIWIGVATIFLGPLMLIDWPKEIPPFVWPIIFLRAILEVIGIVLYLKALKKLDASLATPILSGTNPLFVLILSKAINNEFPSLFKIAGIGIIVLGIVWIGLNEYFSKKEDATRGVATVTIREKMIAGIYMLGAAFVWASCTSLHKVVIDVTNIYWYSGVGTIILAGVFFLSNWYIGFHHLKSFSNQEVKNTGFLGVLNAIGFFLMIFGQSLTLNVFVNAIKHGSTLVTGTIGGWLVFKESIGKRLGGMCLIIIGIIFLVL